jgi:hypothetical protein
MKSAGCTLLITCAFSLPLFGAGTGDPLGAALPVLQSAYVDFPRLQIHPGDTLENVISQGDGKILEVQAGLRPADTTPILAALLPEQVVYCRVATFHPQGSWSDLAAQIGRWIGQGAGGVIIDLRSNGTPDDFDGAAHLAGLFLPAGQPLFGLRDARQNLQPYVSIASSATAVPGLPVAVPVAILVDGRTAGAAEAFSAVLSRHGALVFGEATAGRGGLFKEFFLDDSHGLRYLAGEVVLPDGSTLWGHPVVPDIGVAADSKKEQAALNLIGQEHIADVIGEAAQRHRMSEASLVRGEDPEIDASLAAQSAGPGGLSSPLATQDIVLVDALDSLKAIRFSQQADATTPAGPSNPSTAR